MTTIKIGDLLDFSSPLAVSTCPSGELPQSTGTVHHRPLNYTPEESMRRRQRKPSNKSCIEVEEEEEKCPNVLVRNGVICTPYRVVKREISSQDEFTCVVHQGRSESRRCENGGRRDKSMEGNRRWTERGVEERGVDTKEGQQTQETGNKIMHT